MSAPRHPRVDGYRELVERFGEGRLADALLAKWVADDEAVPQWERLAAVVEHADEIFVARCLELEPVPMRRRRFVAHDRGCERDRRAVPRGRSKGKPLRAFVVLWRLSNGWHREDIAAAWGVSVQTLNSQVRQARRLLGVPAGAQQSAIVAAAIRAGYIP